MKYTNKVPSNFLFLFLLANLCLACSDDSPSVEAAPDAEEQTEDPDDTEEEEETQDEEGQEEEEDQDDDSGEGEENDGENGEDDDEGSDGEDGETTTNFGTITLSGDETSEIGESLTVGHIGVGLTQFTGNERTVILTDSNTPISEEEGPVPEDLENNFIIVGLDLGDQATADADRALSINISVGGTDYKYACASPTVGTFIACGDGLSIDFDKKEMVFDDTKVANTSSGKTITMNGTINW